LWIFAVQIDTKDILFICGGAFVELEKTIAERYGFSGAQDFKLSSSACMHTLRHLTLWAIEHFVKQSSLGVWKTSLTN